MPFEGNLEDLSIVDVIQMLHVSRKSGTLHIQGPGGQASISFRDGGIVAACHPNKEMNIGEILIEMGVIQREVVRQALELQQAHSEDNPQPLVSILIDQGWIDLGVGSKGL